MTVATLVLSGDLVVWPILGGLWGLVGCLHGWVKGLSIGSVWGC